MSAPKQVSAKASVYSRGWLGLNRQRWARAVRVVSSGCVWLAAKKAVAVGVVGTTTCAKIDAWRWAKIKERMTFARLGKIDQPHKTTGAHQDVL